MSYADVVNSVILYVMTYLCTGVFYKYDDNAFKQASLSIFYNICGWASVQLVKSGHKVYFVSFLDTTIQNCSPTFAEGDY